MLQILVVLYSVWNSLENVYMYTVLAAQRLAPFRAEGACRSRGPEEQPTKNLKNYDYLDLLLFPVEKLK